MTASVTGKAHRDHVDDPFTAVNVWMHLHGHVLLLSRHVTQVPWPDTNFVFDSNLDQPLQEPTSATPTDRAANNRCPTRSSRSRIAEWDACPLVTPDSSSTPAA